MNYFDLYAQSKGARKGGLHMTKGFASAINDGIIDEDAILKFLLDSYRVEDDEMGEYFKKIIESSVRQYVGKLMTPTTSQFIANALPTPPLRSLRDTDIQVRIATTDKSYDPMTNVSSSKRWVSE
jgi:hypothetical protein